MRSMRVIVARIWNEPAVAIGFVTSLAAFVYALLTGIEFDAVNVGAILLPLVSSLGIRQVVSPATAAANVPPDTGDADAERKGA